MTQSSPSDLFSFFSDKGAHTVLFKHWQALRRSEKYQRAAQECLTNLKTLYNQWVTEQQTLHPPAPLSPNAEHWQQTLLKCYDAATPRYR